MYIGGGLLLLIVVILLLILALLGRRFQGAPRGRPLPVERGPSGPFSTFGDDATAERATVERCLRCSAAMEWRHQTWQCPRCRFKIGCCEGEGSPDACQSQRPPRLRGVPAEGRSEAPGSSARATRRAASPSVPSTTLLALALRRVKTCREEGVRRTPESPGGYQSIELLAAELKPNAWTPPKPYLA